MSMNRALVLLTKAPIPGFVKTRLVPPLTPKEAAELSRRFLLDLVEMAAELPGVDLFLAYTPDDALDLIPGAARAAAAGCIPQGPGDVGRKVQRVFQTLLDAGRDSVVLISSDIPTVPSEYVAAGFDRLNNHAAALGPCVDGGYYLLGFTRVIPGVFSGIDWSSNRVSLQTREQLQRARVELRCVPPWYDVDTPEDLELLVAQLSILRSSRRGRLPQHTLRYLIEIGLCPAAGQFDAPAPAGSPRR